METFGGLYAPSRIKYMNKRVQKIVSTVRINIDKSFGSRVINLVLFGSQIREKDAEDIDLHLLLDEPHDDDLWLINQCLPESIVKVDFILSYRKDFTNPYICRVRSSGRNFLYPLSLAKVLLGSPSYYKRLLKRQARGPMMKDLLIKNKEHQNGIRDSLVQPNILSRQRHLAKYLVRYMSQTLIVFGALDYTSFTKLPRLKLCERLRLANLLSKDEAEFVGSLLLGNEFEAEECTIKATKLINRFEGINDLLARDYYGI